MSFKQLADFIQSLTEPHLLFDAEYRIISVNPAFRKYCNSQSNVIGKTCYEVSHGYELPCDHSGETCPLRKSLESGKTEHVLHMHNTPEGEEYVSITLTPIKNAKAETIAFVERINPLKTVRHTRSDQLKGSSPAFKTMMELLNKAAASDIPVLIEGESGTGKNTAAQYIHQSGNRCGAPFVTVDCATLTENQFEQDFFGQNVPGRSEKNTKTQGILDRANGGTLFLNDISGLSDRLQAKIASLLETDIYSYTESANTQKTDIRIIASCATDLLKQVEAGLFRKDLYYRIAHFPITLPALRERREDIPLLSEFFLKQFSDIAKPKKLSDIACYELQCYAFPGNIRELKNIIERACLLCNDTNILVKHLQLPQKAKAPTAPNKVIPAFEDTGTLLAHFKGNRKDLAKHLGISERTLYRKLAQLKKNPTVC